MFEQFLFKKIEAWIVILIMIVGSLIAVLFGASVRYIHLDGNRLGRLGPIVENIAAFPSYSIKVIHSILRAKYDLEALEQRFGGQSGFKFNYESGQRPDLGYDFG